MNTASPFRKSSRAARNVYRLYKRRAEKRNLDWSISESEFLLLSQCNCFYCGEPPKQGCKLFKYNGMDRIDNFHGYTPLNVVPCCGRCNSAKSKYSLVDFYVWILKVIKTRRLIP